MLTITVPGGDFFDSASQRFVAYDSWDLELEHSLVSLSKWEIEFEKPFLSDEDKTDEETVGYIRAMTLTPNVPADVYSRLSDENLHAINAYIDRKMTATWFAPSKNTGKEVITSEVIYYWMISAGVPLEWENRHLTRLITLIKVIGEKNAPAKKTPAGELATRTREINERRRREEEERIARG